MVKSCSREWKGPAKNIGVYGKKLVISQGGLISRVVAGMSVSVGPGVWVKSLLSFLKKHLTKKK